MAVYLVQAFEKYMRSPKDAVTEVSLGKVQLERAQQPGGMRVGYNASATADFSKVREAYETDRRRPVILRFRHLEMTIVQEDVAEVRAGCSSAMSSSSNAAPLAPSAMKGVASSNRAPEPPKLSPRLAGTAANDTAPVPPELSPSITLEVVL
eukprot:TRINITY_DN38954_c0_g1_i5.p1 TRINITY_DN38954_c0_g1~~TRINITY_DN38954_c0_g1_i5.p1  ORF type:complete len:169 (-),score=18.93 TRINITY_DN38954_c0_g1_i5:139-594(-)